MKKKAAKKKSTKKVIPEPIRFIFESDDDGHNYLIPADTRCCFLEWLDAAPYWEDYNGEDFNIYRIDGVSDYTFTDPRGRN